MNWKLSDWFKLMMWAAAFGIGVTLLICAPLIWQWLRQIPSTADDKTALYVIFGFALVEMFVISPIVNALKDIRNELRNIKQVLSGEKQNGGF